MLCSVNRFRRESALQGILVSLVAIVTPGTVSSPGGEAKVVSVTCQPERVKSLKRTWVKIRDRASPSVGIRVTTGLPDEDRVRIKCWLM